MTAAGSKPRIVIITTRSDDRHLGGSAVRFGLTRRALEQLGDVSVMLFDDVPAEMHRDGPVADVTLIRRLTRRRPDRALVALNCLAARAAWLDRMIQGRWTPDRPVPADDVDLLWFFKMSTRVRWQGGTPASAAVVVDFDDLEESTRAHRGRLTAALDRWGTLGLRRRLARRADAVSVCSDDDRARAGTSGAAVLPNAVAGPGPSWNPALPPGPHVLFVGRLDYRPNREAVEWFVVEVLPIIRRSRPDVRVRVVGPGAVHLDPAVAECVDAVGAVGELAEHYAWSRICVAPLFTGSGTRVKILEAMSFGRPVVATTLGAEGIDVRPGVDLLVADDPHTFAEACVSVLDPRGPADAVAASGRDLVDSRYSPAAFTEGVARIVAAARSRRDARVSRR
jgi:glycosyltransferase involved in cell wall biosynthesis